MPRNQMNDETVHHWWRTSTILLAFSCLYFILRSAMLTSMLEESTVVLRECDTALKMRHPNCSPTPRLREDGEAHASR